MSTAFFPTNMRAQPSGGTNHKSTYQNITYMTPKGVGVFRNPIGITSTHIRPLTNNDPGNVFPTGFGLPRPLKQYRRGTVIPVHYSIVSADPENPAALIESTLIKYNLNRAVKSSMGSSLGGGGGLMSQLMDMPGSFVIKDNALTSGNIIVGETNVIPVNQLTLPADGDSTAINADCNTCNGIGLVSGWSPINNLSEKPEPNVTNSLLCCNQQKKAYNRVLPASTNLKKNYYQTSKMYLYNRCQTFQQRSFNFINGPIDETVLNIFLKYPFVTLKVIEYGKPGDPLSLANQYVAQCNPNFTVETGAEIAFIQSVTKSLYEVNYLSQSQFNNIYNNKTIQEFIKNLQVTLTQRQYEEVINYLYQLAANPYNGSFLSGPSNPKGCAKVYYKPNNPQFAKQGSVSSSTRTLKLNVDTITTSAARNAPYFGSGGVNINANSLYQGERPFTPFIYKDKTNILCAPQTYIGNPFFFSGQKQNKLICQSKTNGAEYHTYNSVYQGSAGNDIGATQSA